jgi:hypothetical protein
LSLPAEFVPIHQFTKRYNKVLLDKMALENSKKHLLEENGHLKSILKQYLDGLTVNEEVLNNMNPLLVVNGTHHFKKEILIFLTLIPSPLYC